MQQRVAPAVRALNEALEFNAPAIDWFETAGNKQGSAGGRKDKTMDWVAQSPGQTTRCIKRISSVTVRGSSTIRSLTADIAAIEFGPDINGHVSDNGQRHYKISI